jgi:hypothetical protein
MSRRGAEWPATIRHGGEVYTKTGKTGTHERTGRASAEYELVRRVWLLEDGTVEGESTPRRTRGGRNRSAR